MKKLIGIIILVILIILINANCVLAADTLDDMMQDADDFIKQGESHPQINQEKLKDTSNLLYNVLLGIGIFVAAGVGMFLGIKYMVGSIDEKAATKEALVGYGISCGVIFGAFGIWQLLVNILSDM